MIIGFPLVATHFYGQSEHPVERNHNLKSNQIFSLAHKWSLLSDVLAVAKQKIRVHQSLHSILILLNAIACSTSYLLQLQKHTVLMGTQHS